jgi:hypothetical protein
MSSAVLVLSLEFKAAFMIATLSELSTMYGTQLGLMLPLVMHIRSWII